MALSKFFYVCLVLLPSNMILAFLRPHSLKIEGVNFELTSIWEVSQLENSSLNRENALSMRTLNSTDEMFTVYIREYRVSENFYQLNGFGSDDQGIWSPVKGCTAVTGTKCKLQKVIEYIGDHEFWVALSTSSTHLSFAEVPSDQTLIYNPERHMIFTAPQFTATRSKSSIQIEIQPLLSKQLGKVTVAEHLTHSGFEPTYSIEYYVRINESVIEQKTQQQIPASSRHYNLVTSFPKNVTVCVAIRFDDDNEVSNNHSPYREMCLPPVEMTELLQTPAFYWILIGLCVLLGLSVLIIMVKFCSKDGKKLFRRVFSIQDVKIPEKTEEIITEGPTLMEASLLTETEVTREVVDPCVVHVSKSRSIKIEKLEDPVFEHDYLPSSSYESKSGTEQTKAQDREKNQSLSSSTYAKMVFYEHKPGAYISDCVFLSDQQENRILNRDRLDQVEARQNVLPSDGSDNSGSDLVVKRRYYSEDSAFYDDIALIGFEKFTDNRNNSVSSGS